MHLDQDTQMLRQNLLALRKKYSLTQKEMSVKLGVGVKTLRKLERGIIPERLSCDFLFSIQFHFGISPAKLFTVPLKK